MPILRLNAGPDGLVLNGSPAPAQAALRTAARGTGPVMILIHGFKYDPDCPPRSPHTTIFGHGTHPDKTGDVQWLRHLGFGNGDAGEGLAVAFAWRARGNIWRAARSARTAGHHLAHTINVIYAVAPARPIHVITHSMGSEVIFDALHHVTPGAVQRIVTITGASYASRAQAAMTSDAGRRAELINVTSRENDLFDFLFERLITPPDVHDRAMGGGIDLPNAVTLQLDCADTLAQLAALGTPIAAPHRRMCHWSGYTRTGALRFYARCLRDPAALPLRVLQQAVPGTSAPRWSRIFARPKYALPLPMAQKHAS